MRFSRSSYVIVLLWFIAPGLVGGFLAWIFGRALFEVLRCRLPRTFALARVLLIPTDNSPQGDLLPSRSARTVFWHFGLFLTLAVAIGYQFTRLR